MTGLDRLEQIVEEVDDSLDDKDTVRELAMKSSRAIRRLSRKVIQSIHNGEDAEEIRDTLNEAFKEVSKVKSIIEGHPELYHAGFLRNGFQELAEAHLIWALSQGEELKPPQELDITPSSYLLGLGDTIGELRRMALDELTEGNLEEAKEVHSKMERIRNLLMGFDYPKAIVPLRNKQDMARTLVEKTRGDIANAVRNEELMGKMDRLREDLEE